MLHPTGVVLENDLDRRVLAWLLETAGEQAVRRAVAQCPPGAIPWPSVVCRVLDVAPPPEVKSAPKDRARHYLQAIKQILKKSSQ